MEKTSTDSEKEAGSANIPLVKIETLRRHFKKTYKLADDQIDLLLASSARSLQTTLAAAEEVLLQPDYYEKLAHHAHSMKGLLLNMGEDKWAARAREIEKYTLEKKELDYKRILKEISLGVREII